VPRAPLNRWLTFASLGLIYFVITAGAFSSLGVALPAMVKELNWNWQQAGLGYTLLGVACGLGSLIPAILIRRTACAARWRPAWRPCCWALRPWR
jgi:predicted MFS family arabinose efflux permease